MKIANTLRDRYNSKNVLAFEWVLAIAVGVLVFITTAYDDGATLTIWSTNVWDVTLDSNIRHLYELTAQNIHNTHSHYMGSELMSVLPWSIWNLPIWAIQRFCGIEIITSPLLLAWSKLFLVFLTAIMLRYTYLIGMQLTNDRTKSMLCVFLTASSVGTYMSVCYAGQNDILMMLPSVMAVYYLLKGNKKAFFIWSIVAISIKPFYVLAFLAVLMLFEKSIPKIFLKLLLSVSGIVAQKLLFWGAPMYSESMEKGPSSKLLEEMFPKNLNTSFGPISFFAIALVLIYFYCYTRKLKETDADFAKYVIYIIGVTYTLYLMFSPFSYYRIFIIAPFVYLIMVQNSEIIKYNVILETAYSAAIMMKLILRGSRFFLVDSVNGSLVQGLFGFNVDGASAYHPSVQELLVAKLPLLDSLQPLFSGVAFISLLLILVLNNPVKKFNLPSFGKENPRIWIWLRTIIFVPFVLLLVALFLKCEYRIY